MTIREEMEEREYRFLRPEAAHAKESLGRGKEEKPCDIRTCYQRDRDRILHSKSFRRLKNKTQVFLKPEDDHYRTRLMHTLEVSQIARTIAKALRLNEDLTEAIALGHDVGHTPYGHSGEKVLNEILTEKKLGGFRHNEQGVRLLEVIERDGRGLNLTAEVLDGILHHGTAFMPKTWEAKIVRLSDKIAYLHHDTEDAIRAHILSEDDLPSCVKNALGQSAKERLNRMIHDMISVSDAENTIRFSEEIDGAMHDLREFMFQAVYSSKAVKAEEKKAMDMIRALYEYYDENVFLIPETYQKLIERGDRKEIVVADYISGMTDLYAMQMYEGIVKKDVLS